MEAREEDVPLPEPKTVGIIYNLKKGIRTDVPDAEAELDSIETVHAIEHVLNGRGYATVLLEADRELPKKLAETRIDIAFNIAEGLSGRGREAQVPALLDMMGIPYTGSDSTTLCLALDKALTKRLLASYHIKTPQHVLVSRDEPATYKHLRYPVIVKPNAEGSSKGISEISVAESAEELRLLVRRNLELYREDMLIEGYVPGREFTVGVLGNGKSAHVFSPMEIVYRRNTQGAYRVYSYTVKQNFPDYVHYECPARLGAEAEKRMAATARRVFEVLGCRDFARIDFRLTDDEKELYFIEINPLPGLAPSYSDFPMLAGFCGMPYDELVAGVLSAALNRSGLEK